MDCHNNEKGCLNQGTDLGLCRTCLRKLVETNISEVKAWKAKYPSHCTHCNGAGYYWDVVDVSPIGQEFEDFLDCAWCKGCPRCG